MATTVLVVDDEAPIRYLCRVNLEAAGVEVLEAPDRQSGLEAARRHLPDMILLGVMMPGLDGWTVAERLQRDERTRYIPIVCLTARSKYRDRLRGLELGAVDYITKPFNPLDLAPHLEATLTRIRRGEREDLRSEKTTEIQGLIEEDPAGPDGPSVRPDPSKREPRAVSRSGAAVRSESQRQRNVLGVKWIVSAIVIAAAAAGTAYITFVDPRWRVDDEASAAWTRDCMRRAGFTYDPTSDRLSSGLDVRASQVAAYNQPGPGNSTPTLRVTVFRGQHDDLAAKVAPVVRATVRKWAITRAAQGGLPERNMDQKKLRKGVQSSVVLRDGVLVGYLGNESGSFYASAKARRPVLECVVTIRKSAWGGLALFDQTKIEHPFL
jgi:CheY-like chemotaxis protein